jgi:hypothetical protein
MRSLFLLSTLLLGTHLASAGNFAVGTCKPMLKSFTTIQGAVSSVPPGSNILVCPGTYPEQVTISQSLRLQGVADSNLGEVLITIPSTGLTGNVTSVFGEPVAAQLLVQTTGQVNISNITVDGTGGDDGCANWLAGIFYGGGASGNIVHVRTRNQIDTNCGVGVWAENGSGSSASIAIQNSSVHDADAAGIFVGASSTSPLSVAIRGNFVSPNSVGGFAVDATSVTGDITNNDLTGALVGVYDLAPGLNISGNGVSAVQYGMLLLAPGTAQYNDIMNTGLGFSLSTGTLLQANRITQSSTVAIELNCSALTVSHNTINDAVVGLGDVPAGFSASNIFANTGTISTNTCTAPVAALSVKKGAARAANTSSFLQWRTPANPNGVRPLH